MLFEPQNFGHRMFVAMQVIVVRRNAESQLRIGHVFPVVRHVVDGSMKVIGRREPQDWALDARDVGIVGNAGQFDLAWLGFDSARHSVL